jgi:hypothetical protein
MRSKWGKSYFRLGEKGQAFQGGNIRVKTQMGEEE